MQSLQHATIQPEDGAKTVTPDACAEAVLDGLPPVMWFVRRHMRRHPAHGLSVPQYRFLCVLDASPSDSLSAVAENLGVELPGASRCASGLVAKGLVARKTRAGGDRRQMGLALTAKGRTVLNARRRDTERRVADEIAHLSEAQRAAIVDAMNLLRDVFAPAPAPAANAAAPPISTVATQTEGEPGR